MFVGRNDGRLTALDSRNGKQLWEFQTGAGMNAPVSVFEHNGKQYVVAYSAGNVLRGHGAAATACGCSRSTARSTPSRRVAKGVETEPRKAEHQARSPPYV